MSLRRLQAAWDRLGRDDPLWAIVSTPGMRGNRWREEEFLVTGREEIATAMDMLGELGLPREHESALDFGCGVGRLTRALADHFRSVDGVDIAPSMIEQARAANPAPDRIRYHLNDTDSLGAFPDASFDLVLSRLVLQHIEPRYSIRYVLEFVRLLRPGGAALFQLPSAAAEVTPLADAGFRAALAPDAPEALRAPAGARVAITVDVRNASPLAWPARQEIKLANHWRRADGELVANDDGRTSLPATLAAGERAVLELVVEAPATPGDYLLELDMVQDGVAWFADRGSPTATIRATVSPGAAIPGVSADAPAAGGDPLAATIEMHAVRTEFVRELLAYAGAEVRHAAEDGAAGEGWVSMLYVATVR